MADAAVLPADPAAALKRAQQGKSYWRRVWERLRDDKVTLAVIGVLAMLLVMVVFAPWFTVHDPYTRLGAATAEAGRHAGPLARHRRGRARPVVAHGLWRAPVAAGRGGAGVPGAADRRLPRHPRRLCRRPRQQRDHASDRRALCLSVDPAGDRHHRHPRFRSARTPFWR